MSVLILDGHSRAALEALQAFGRAGVVADISNESDAALSLHSAYPRNRFKQPPLAQPRRFTDWLQSLDDRHEYALIVPATESSLIALNALPDGHPLREKSVMPAQASLDVALNKQATWELASRLGIPVPRCTLLTGSDDVRSAATFPTVLKPVRSKIMVGNELITVSVAVVGDMDSRTRYLNSWLPHTAIQEQEYFPGRGVGIELLCEHGETRWHFAHERIHEYPLSGGASTYRRSIEPPRKMLADVRRLLEALGWHGVAMVEFKLNDDGDYRLVEINPRLWGSLALSIDAGVNFPLGLLCLATKQALGPQPHYRVDYFTRDLLQDMVWFKDNLVADHQAPLLMTRPVIRSVVELFRPAIGKESWDHFDVGDLAVTSAILRQAWRKLSAAFLKRASLASRRRRAARKHPAVMQKLLSSREPGKVIFLCHGNICRSPFAAEYAKLRIREVEFVSAGLHSKTGRNSPPNIVCSAANLGIDLSRHASRPVTGEMIDSAQLILVMDIENYDQAIKSFPNAKDRISLLGLCRRVPISEIEDPYTMPPSETQKILQVICDAIDGLAAAIGSMGLAFSPTDPPREKPQTASAASSRTRFASSNK